MTHSAFRVGLFASPLLFCMGCKSTDAGDTVHRSFEASVTISSDPGIGVPGARILRGTEPIGESNASGVARVTLEGTEGDLVRLAVHCPEGFESPPAGVDISLRTMEAQSPIPNYATRCAPLARTVVVGVRTERGEQLPILYLGKEVGRTNDQGVCHLSLTVRPGEQVTLELDTKSRGENRPKLRPANPTLTFVAKDKDDFVALDQKFEIEPKPAPPKGPAPRRGPTRL